MRREIRENTAITRQNFQTRGLRTRFKPGNKAASVQKGKKKLTERKFQEVLINAINRILDSEENRNSRINFKDIQNEVRRILLMDGLYAKKTEVRLNIAVMLFKHSISNQ